MKRLLLLSNSTNFGSGYLDHAIDAIARHFDGVKRIAFVPFALFDQEAYTAVARQRFAREGIEVEGVTPDAQGVRALETAEGVFVGGGNTFRLLLTLQRSGVLPVLRRRALEGLPYMGASAGTNIAGPTIRTTNDMPIVEPESFDALGVVPFQINPHYLDPEPGSQHMGETRETRLKEFLEENATPVVGLREGAWIRVEGDAVVLEGPKPARIFRRGLEPEERDPGASLADLGA